MNAQTMYQGEEVQEDGEDTDKGYNSYHGCWEEGKGVFGGQ